VGQILPGTADAFDLRLSAEPTLGADLARHAGYLAGERVELVDRHDDRVLELENLSLHFDGDLLGQVAARHCGRDFGDVAHLSGYPYATLFRSVGQVLPGAADALDLRLAAELAFGADLARHARHLGRERIQ